MGQLRRSSREGDLRFIDGLRISDSKDSYKGCSISKNV